MFFFLIAVLCTTIVIIDFAINSYHKEMSSQMNKRVQLKSNRRLHHRLFSHCLPNTRRPRRRCSTSSKTKSSSAIASITDSIDEFRNHLYKFFSKLASKRRRRYEDHCTLLEHGESLFEAEFGHGIKLESGTAFSPMSQISILNDQQHHHQLLPLLVNSDNKRTIVLDDLDETTVNMMPQISILNDQQRDHQLLPPLVNSNDKETIVLDLDETTSDLMPQISISNDQQNHQLLPPLVNSNKKGTIVLDLDETLVHSSPGPPTSRCDFMIEPSINGITMNFYVLKRPGVDEFLEEIGEKYEIVVFTAGLQPYASLVLDKLDPKGLISHRLYRDSCNQLDQGGRFVKDLSKIGRDLRKVVIVDDNPNSYSLQLENAIPITRFENDMKDRELEKLMGFFGRYCDGFEDMRDSIKQYLHDRVESHDNELPFPLLFGQCQ